MYNQITQSALKKRNTQDDIRPHIKHLERPKEFDKAAQVYNTKLKTSGYKENVGYGKIEATQKTLRKGTSCGIIPPYSVNVATNVGNKFFQHIDKHFPPHNRLYKIKNHNCKKMSYSCIPNISVIISLHSKSTLH